MVVNLSSLSTTLLEGPSNTIFTSGATTRKVDHPSYLRPELWSPIFSDENGIIIYNLVHIGDKPSIELHSLMGTINPTIKSPHLPLSCFMISRMSHLTTLSSLPTIATSFTRRPSDLAPLWTSDCENFVGLITWFMGKLNFHIPLNWNEWFWSRLT